MDFRQTARDRDAELSVETLERMLLADRNAMITWEDLKDLRGMLKTLAVDSEERKVHLWRIFRESLSVEARSCFFSSFCQKDWKYVHDYKHCAICNK